MAMGIENIEAPVSEPIEGLEPSDLEIRLELYLPQFSTFPTILSKRRPLYRWPRLRKSSFKSRTND